MVKIFLMLIVVFSSSLVWSKSNWLTQGLRSVVRVAEPLLSDRNKKNWHAIIANLEQDEIVLKNVEHRKEEEKHFAGDLPDDLQDLINSINNPDILARFGISLPKGILLVGPPGTGKTSMAREVARRTNAGFFHASASSFIEMYVGVGASRIRELFQKAKSYTAANPGKMAIIFIDDIDAVAGRRSFNDNDERRQTVNELLNQMDGFIKEDMIIVIAATNDPKMLDEAVKRSGRFDKIIEVPLPSEKNRLQLLLHYAQKHGIAIEGNSIPFGKYSLLTHGFCCADIKTMVNSAAQYAMREKASEITEQHFDKALQELIAKKKW